jgi:hypothetical protein
LPIAANEYWMGSQGDCPYANCGEPYSFVRDPEQPPPFFSTDGGATWQRNYCPNPYNQETCQGPYAGAGENYGRAFALMGADAKPNWGSADPRGFVHLDWRYNALVDGQDGWYHLVADDTWVGPTDPAGSKEEMKEVIRSGGYCKVQIPGAVQEPPPYEPYIGQWGYCWDTPGPDTCFNYPETDRSPPYEVVEFLSGADSAKAAKMMYDDGDYLDGRYAPGQRIVIAVYNGYPGDHWGAGTYRDDAAVLVGYFRAVIVGYGNTFQDPCPCPPFDLECFQGCISGLPNTVYGLADSPLVLDPTPLLPTGNQAPYAPHTPVPTDTAASIPLTQTLSWQGGDRDCGTVHYTLALGLSDPPPVVATGLLTPTYDPAGLLTCTIYYWAVTATDGISTTAGPTWSFSTIVPPDAPPNVPHAPDPADGASDVSLEVVLAWEGGAPDEFCDPVSYTLAFGPSDPPPVVATGLLSPTYDPGPLAADAAYYWAITATDRLTSTAGPRWHFATRPLRLYLPVMCKPDCWFGPP